MSNKIINSYAFSAIELDFIKSKFFSHEDWDKDIFDSIKSNIRCFLRNEQGNKCCYCKKELGFDIKEVDIEHIIPKATYNKFTFEPKNLALSCPACNTIKGDSNILSRKIVRYPKHSKHITIVHAHYDNYDQHITIHDGYVFEALDSKGSHTITTCKLFRLKKVEKKAKEVLINRSPNNQLLNLIINASKEELAEAMAELIKRIK